MSLSQLIILRGRLFHTFTVRKKNSSDSREVVGVCGEYGDRGGHFL